MRIPNGRVTTSDHGYDGSIVVTAELELSQEEHILLSALAVKGHRSLSKTIADLVRVGMQSSVSKLIDDRTVTTKPVRLPVMRAAPAVKAPRTAGVDERARRGMIIKDGPDVLTLAEACEQYEGLTPVSVNTAWRAGKFNFALVERDAQLLRATTRDILESQLTLDSRNRYRFAPVRKRSPVQTEYLCPLCCSKRSTARGLQLHWPMCRATLKLSTEEAAKIIERDKHTAPYFEIFNRSGRERDAWERGVSILNVGNGAR